MKNKNHNFLIVKEYTIEEGIEICKKSKSKRLKSLSKLSEQSTKCNNPTCNVIGTKFCIGTDKAGNNHIDLYSEDMTMITIDHIMPKSKGGKNTIDNYQLLCKPCNELKGDKIL